MLLAQAIVLSVTPCFGKNSSEMVSNASEHDFAGVEIPKKFKRTATSMAFMNLVQWLCYRLSGGGSPGNDGLSCGLGQHRRVKKMALGFSVMMAPG
jgi:hypothetical protein